MLTVFCDFRSIAGTSSGRGPAAITQMLKTLPCTERPQCLNGPTSKGTTKDDICVGLHSLVMSTPLGRVSPFLCKSRAHPTMMLSCLANTNWAFISWITGFEGALAVAKWFGRGGAVVSKGKSTREGQQSIGENESWAASRRQNTVALKHQH